MTDLGFAEKCKSKWLLANRYFPSKIGGKPAWLNLRDIPSKEKLMCVKCEEPLLFLCQVYAPITERIDCFHRTIFVFICKTQSCYELNDSRNILVFRSQLPLLNEFYPAEPPDESIQLNMIASPIKLCNLCGCRGPSMCSKCKKVNYCSQTHQKIDWKHHKLICSSNNPLNAENTFSYLFAEYELVLEEENEEVVSTLTPDEFERKQMEIYKTLVEEGKTGDMSIAELEQYTEDKTYDKTFKKFKKRIDKHPNQVLRYCRNDVLPLWISPIKKLNIEDVPKCELCGGNRIFEFQIMPQMINILENENIDWGIIAVFTCAASCSIDTSYSTEFVYKQDILPETDNC